jgi:TonB family protein
MRFPKFSSLGSLHAMRLRRRAIMHLLASLTLIAVLSVFANGPASAQSTTQNEPKNAESAAEEALKQQLAGKPLFLRGGYLGDSLSFTEHGDPVGHPVRGSYTLSAVEIDKVHLTKHRVELEGSRYALHFLGALPYEDSSKAVDRIKITSKKKVLKISIDRERVIKQKKVKGNKKGDRSQGAAAGTAPPASQPVASSETDAAAPTRPAPAKPAPAQASAATSADQTGQASTSGAGETSPAPEQTAGQTPDQLGEQPAADQASVTTTVSPAHAAKVLQDALDRIFASGLDDKLRAQMPEFWQLYYQAQAAGVEYRPHDQKVLRSSAVDQQAKLLTSIAPESNEYAQSNGIVGRALYRAVIDSDGKPGEIAAVRPIGFGLDENAVAAIRKASFQPAVKDGQPVAEALDLVVLFRIYSNRTSATAAGGQAEPGKPGEPAKPVLPGPYSVKQP